MPHLGSHRVIRRCCTDVCRIASSVTGGVWYTDDLLEVETRRKLSVEELIAELRRPENRISPGGEYPVVIPGGEMLPFSVPSRR